jgi:hypothetical protein
MLGREIEVFEIAHDRTPLSFSARAAKARE